MKYIKKELLIKKIDALLDFFKKKDPWAKEFLEWAEKQDLKGKSGKEILEMFNKNKR